MFGYGGVDDGVYGWSEGGIEVCHTQLIDEGDQGAVRGDFGGSFGGHCGRGER